MHSMIKSLALLGALLAGPFGVPAAVPDSDWPAVKLPAPGSPASAAVGADVALGAVGRTPFQAPPVRLWLAEDTDHFYPGDPVQVHFRAAEDAYVAIVHLDPEGNLDLVFPTSVAGDAFVRGRRTYTLSDWGSRFALGRTPGIGYFYIIASPRPLDLRPFRTAGDRWGSAWVVRGDPFWAFEELTQLLIRNPRFTPYAVDLLSYHVGGRHRYPAYACYPTLRGVDPRVSSGYYPSCDRLQRLLVTFPYYYDTRRYRGDRAAYLRELNDLAPRHDFKESFGGAAPPLRQADPRGTVQRPDPRRTDERSVPPATGERGDTRAEPARQRPALERRPPSRETERSAPPRTAPEAAPPRATPAPRAEPRAEPPRESPPPRQEGDRRREEVRPEARRPPEPRR
jgi:hypothetical protein